MLEVRNLYFRHQKRDPDILRQVEFRVNGGTITAILGPNGSGKTTLFKCLMGLWRPQKGEILLEKKDISRVSTTERARIFGVVPQEHDPPFPYSVMDVVLMGRASHLGLFSSPSPKDYRICEASLEMVGIVHLRERPYTKISGGERQLVLIARALSQQAPILLLDEPTTHLDFRNQVNVLKKVRELAREQRLTILMTLHDPNLAVLFSDEVILMNHGTVLANGKPHAVINEKSLHEVYGIDVSIIDWNGTKVIYPRVEA
ncbi:MAG: ABC transporter ATP-binding protein [Desulfobacterota bacterium]|nr:ABC transporter ATP-binding protein [Thermodesulfobacteriota bacterium]